MQFKFRVSNRTFLDSLHKDEMGKLESVGFTFNKFDNFYMVNEEYVLINIDSLQELKELSLNYGPMYLQNDLITLYKYADE